MTRITRTPQGNYSVLLLPGVLLAGILNGCGAIHNMAEPVRPTAVEQFLMTQAVEHSLNEKYDMLIPLTYGDTVNLDTTGNPPSLGFWEGTFQERFFRGAIAGWLGEKGLNIVQSAEVAKYRVHILVQAFGTEQSEAFFGLPPIQSVLIPFALPEIAVFKAQYQTGHTRFRLDIYETETGKFIRSTPWFQGSTYFNEYTILFFFDFFRTDLIAPF